MMFVVEYLREKPLKNNNVHKGVFEKRVGKIVGRNSRRSGVETRNGGKEKQSLTGSFFGYGILAKSYLYVVDCKAEDLVKLWTYCCRVGGDCEVKNIY
jgi:hypothetical protein